MRYFEIPFDTHSEDKIIGGYLSIRQFFWLSLPLVVALLLFVANRGYLRSAPDGSVNVIVLKLVIRIIFVIISGVFGCMCAFVKINSMNYFKYLIKRIKFYLTNHKYRYER